MVEAAARVEATAVVEPGGVLRCSSSLALAGAAWCHRLSRAPGGLVGGCSGSGDLLWLWKACLPGHAAGAICMGCDMSG